ncbi:MAG: hypothetical protein ACOZIN_12540 [Myxococcota bacterium]
MRERRIIQALVLGALAAASPTSAFAQSPPDLRDLMHARNFGMGGAYRAHGLGAEAAFGNPAAVGLYRRYQLDLSGAWDATHKFGFGTLAIVDSATSNLAAGIAYHFASVGRGSEHTNVHLNTAAFALPFGQALHLGVSARHLLMNGATEANAVTMDAGALVRLGGFAVSFSGHNLVDVHNPLLSRFYNLGVAYLGGLFTAALDVRADFGGPSPLLSYAGGVEYIIGAGLPLRAGYTTEPAQGQQWLSAGVGIITEGGGLDVAYRHELGGLTGRLIALTLKMQVQ